MKKFYKITSPLKFRFIRMLIQIFKDLVNSSKYNWYSILYKLNKIERYQYSDTIEKEIYYEPITYKEVTTLDFNALVELKVTKEKIIDIDYFHRGNKILHINKDFDEDYYFGDFILSNIKIITNGKFYNVDHLPTFKVSFISEDFKKDTITTETLTLDITKLKNLRVRRILSSLEKEELEFVYEEAIDIFEEHLSEMNLMDLVVR